MQIRKPDRASSASTGLPMSSLGKAHLAIDTGLRHVTCVELLEVGEWRLKLYGMGLEGRPPSAARLEQARDLIRATLPTPAITGQRYGVGFATVHAGEEGDYLLLDWWHSQDLLRHHLFGAPHRRGEDPSGQVLRYGWPQNTCCCLWELAVLWFERNAWYHHVLRDNRGDLKGYLAERLEGTV